MSLASLNKTLEKAVRHQNLKVMDDCFLQNVAALWRAYVEAKKHVAKRFDASTTKAEQILRLANQRRILRACVQRNLLPTRALKLQIDEGAPFRGYFATLDEKVDNRPKLISGGAFEMNRRKH